MKLFSWGSSDLVQTPYLHFETNEGRVRLRHAIKQMTRNGCNLAADYTIAAPEESLDFSTPPFSSENDNNNEDDNERYDNDDNDDSSDESDEKENNGDYVDDDGESSSDTGEDQPIVESQRKASGFKSESYSIHA